MFFIQEIPFQNVFILSSLHCANDIFKLNFFNQNCFIFLLSSMKFFSMNRGADQRKHQSSASPAFVRGIHRFPFDDVIMTFCKVKRPKFSVAFIVVISILIHDDVIKWKQFPVLGEFPAQRPMTRSFDVFFDLRLNKPLSKQSWGWWFETLSRPLWRLRSGLC